MKDGSSLVVIPSSIPSSATRGLNMDLSSEGSEDILEDPDDELVLKKRISNSDDEGSVPPEAEFHGYLPFSLPSFLFLPSSFFPFFLSSFPYTYVLASLLCCNLPLFVRLFPCFAETFEGLGVTADIGMPLATALATPIAPVSAIPTTPVSVVRSVLVSAVPTTPIPMGSSEFLISSFISFC